MANIPHSLGKKYLAAKKREKWIWSTGFGLGIYLDFNLQAEVPVLPFVLSTKK